MTRPRGTVPVRLARHRAEAFVEWLLCIQIPKGTILCDAGIPQHKSEARDNRKEDALDELRDILSLKHTGRPRKPLATYYLPIEGLRLLNEWTATMSIPRELRPLMWRLHTQMRLRHRELLTPEVRQKNLANGKYAPETIRRYRRQLKQPRPIKGNGLFGFNPEDRAGRRAAVLNPLALAILPQFFSS